MRSASLRLPSFWPTSANHSGSRASTVAVAPASISLRAIIQLRQRTGHPVLLVDNGCFCGICDEAEIVRALAGRAEDLHGAA